MLAGVIDEVGGAGALGDPRAGRPDDHYGALVRSIVGQQLSTRAARAIYARLTDRYGGRTPTPAEVLEDDPDELRVAAGLSHAKVSYLRSLAEHVIDGSLELDALDSLPDDEVIAKLTAIKGIGLWSAQLYLMFHLRASRCGRGRRPRTPQGGDAALRACRAPRRGDDGADRRAMATVPDAREPLPMALALRDTGVGPRSIGSPRATWPGR